jgi:hypothetical protein
MYDEFINILEREGWVLPRSTDGLNIQNPPILRATHELTDGTTAGRASRLGYNWLTYHILVTIGVIGSSLALYNLRNLINRITCLSPR